MTLTTAPAGRPAKRRRLGGGKPGASRRMAGDKIQRGVLTVTIVLLVAMVAVAVALSMTTHDGGAGVASFVLFAAASAVGAGFGFLFGLPRARAADVAGGDSASPAPPAATSASTYYLTNSNLIKVSDWLTTIVIGLGLVNLARLVPAVRRLGHALHRPLGDAPYSGAVGISVLVVGLLAGFVLDYLWTSIRVRELLEESERQLEDMPAIKGGTVAEARRDLAAKGLSLLGERDMPDDATVVAQALPAGTPVARGTDVAVTVLANPAAAPGLVPGAGS